MVAAQQSLTGLGAACWFSNWVAEWDSSPSTKWTYSTPMQIGQFPAAAWIYRQGLVKLGEPAVLEQRSLQNLWDRKTPMISEEPGWDPNRDQGNLPPTAAVKTVVDPLAYLVGPSEWSTAATRPGARWPICRNTSTAITGSSAASPARSRPTTAGGFSA